MLFKKTEKTVHQPNPSTGIAQPNGKEKKNAGLFKKICGQSNSKPKIKSAQNQLKYEMMYEDGICFLGNGKYSVTFQLSDINYQIARGDDQREIFTRYCEILNFLDPQTQMQINCINQKIDTTEIDKLFHIQYANDGLDTYRDEMTQIVCGKAMEGDNSILRSKYITLTVAADSHTQAVKTLRRKESDISNLFRQLGCSVSSLSGKERLRILSSLLMPDEPFLFDYSKLVDSNWTTKDFICPAFDFTDRKIFRMGDLYAQTIYLRDYPTELSDNILARILELPFNMNVSLLIDTMDQTSAVEFVRKKLAYMRQEKINAEQKAIKSGYSSDSISYELLQQISATESLLDNLTQHNQRFFKMILLVSVSAETKELLQARVDQIVSTARKANCIMAALHFMQRDAFNSSLPIGNNLLNAQLQRTLTTVSAAIFVPFTAQELFQPNGMYYGINAVSHNLILFDRYGLKTPSGMILGTPGSGKGMFAKREMINVLLNDPNAEVIVIDPEREYTSLANAFGGEVIHISAGSNNYINLMEINEDYADNDDPLLLKTEFVLSVCEQIIGGNSGLTPGERSVIDRACRYAYSRYFRKSHPAKEDLPTLKDFYENLKQMDEPEAKQLALSLEIYINGSLSVFAHPTNVNTNKRLVVFDIRDLGKNLRSLGMLVVLDQIWNRITSNRNVGKRTWIYIDEIQLLLSSEATTQYFFELWSRSRKWGAVPTAITQSVDTLLQNSQAKTMLKNSDFVAMLNQSSLDRVDLAELFNISNQQLSHVTNSDPGCGLLYIGRAIIPFEDKFPKETKLYQLMTTKIEDIVEQQTRIKEEITL